MRRYRTPLVLGFGLFALALAGCESRGWVVQRYPSDANTNVAAADPLGAAIVAKTTDRRLAAAEALADSQRQAAVEAVSDNR